MSLVEEIKVELEERLERANLSKEMLEDNKQETQVSLYNGFIITWILHQIIMYSNKVKLVAGQNNDLLNSSVPINKPN